MNRNSRPHSSIARLGALAALALGVVASGACEPIVVTPVVPRRGANDPYVGPGATGPWGRCQFEVDSPVPPHDMPTICPDPNADTDASGSWTCWPAAMSQTFETGYLYCQALARCIYSCTTAADCPAPPSGSATPECWNGDCHLACTDSAECPVGMECTEVGCMWVYADFCDNGSISPADPCAGKATGDACEICEDCDAIGFCNHEGKCQCDVPENGCSGG